MKRVFLFFISLFLVMLLEAQDWKRTSVWYFGQNAGLDFNTDPPTPLTDGKVNTIEGCATISDITGNLLFYTDGSTVWNKNHQVMSNGTGLLGHSSSTQAALIIPHPANDSLYYVFTVSRDAFPNSGFHYNVVNINGDNGMGEIIRKNILLHIPVSEKLAAVRHLNGTDYWVSTTEYLGNRLYTYLITRDGIIECPVISSMPVMFSSSTAVGALKFSPSGRLAAMAKNNSLEVDIMQFNNEEGTFEYLFSIEHSNPVYGVEFSRSEKYLYVMAYRASLFQYDLTSLQKMNVLSSKQTIYTVSTSIYDIQALQLAANEKIYMAFVSSEYLGVINNPDSVHGQVDFDTIGQHLGGKKSSYGLPAMVASFFYTPDADFTYSWSCEDNHLALIPKTLFGGGTYYWKITRSSGGGQVFSSSDYSPEYGFSDTGLFDISFRYIVGNDTFFAEKQIHVKPPYTLNLGNDTTLCAGTFLMLTAGDGQHCYLWQDGSSGSSFAADTSGVYHVKVVSENFCTYHDSIYIQLVNNPDKPVITRSNDSLFTDTGYGYQWYRNGMALNGSDSFFHPILANGHYQVLIKNAFGCTAISDSFSVTGVGIPTPETAEYRIYPNPSEKGNELTIEGKELIQSIRVYDLTGKPVFKADNIHDFRFQLSIHQQGTYILRINGTINFRIMIL